MNSGWIIWATGCVLVACGCERKLHSERDDDPRPLDIRPPTGSAGSALAGIPPASGSATAAPLRFSPFTPDAVNFTGTPYTDASSDVLAGLNGDLRITAPLSINFSAAPGNLDKFVAGLSVLEASAGTGPTAENDRLWRQGLEFFQKGQTEQALVTFQKLRILDPRDRRGHLGEAAIYLQREQFSSALAAFDFAIRIQPDDYDVYLQRARAHTGLREYGAAADDYAKYLDKHPDQNDVRLQRAEVNLLRRDVGAVIADANLIVRTNPNIPFAYFLRAIAWAWQGKIADAQKDFELAEKNGLPAEMVRAWRPQFFPQSVD